MSAEHDKDQIDERNRFQTIVFDDAASYVRFTDVTFGKPGWTFSNVPILKSIRATAELQDYARGQGIPFRQVTQEDLDKARERTRGLEPFDPKIFEVFRDEWQEIVDETIRLDGESK